jgi:hypothetical protein
VDVDEVLKAASTRALSASDVEALLAACPEPRGAALDRLSMDVASRFILGRVPFLEACAAVTAMFNFAKSRDVPAETLCRVFAAFDAGHAFSGGSSPLENPVEACTRPRLARLLVRLVGASGQVT